MSLMQEAAPHRLRPSEAVSAAGRADLNDSRRARLMVILGHVCALTVAGVFLYAAYSKILEPRQFALDIKNFRILPERYLNLMAIFLPWWEVAGAIGLIIPRMRRGAAVLLSALLLMFIIAVIYAAFYKGYNINCGCFGKDSAAAGWKTIGLDVALFAGTMASLLGCGRRTSVPAG